MSKIRVADYVAQKLAEAGVRDVFLVTGGGAMHLNDAFGRHPKLRAVACHHEQACSMAAESYFRMTNRLAAVNVTTGPGGTNAITGVYGAYVDSIGMIVISGQVKWETLVRSTNLPLRQLGDQEIDIIKMVESVTKYAVVVKEASEIRYHVEKALYLATSGRPGPVWLDVPINVQGSLIDPSTLKGFDAAAEAPRLETPSLKGDALLEQAKKALSRLSESQRPIIMAGAGVRLSGQHDRFIKLIDKLGIPVATCWNAHDVLWNDHPLYAGRPGTVGDRGGNFSVQNSDFLLVLGSRLNIRQISYAWGNFARAAYKVMVDIDPAELAKPTLKLDQPVHADLRDWFEALEKAIDQTGWKPKAEHTKYVQWCRDKVKRYPATLPEYWDLKEKVNPYCFSEALFKILPENEPVVSGNGTACVTSFQAAHLKKGQRLYTNSGCASMGYDLPAAIGAAVALDAKRLVCITGDGSLQMNLQELQTMRTLGLPIKLFVLNNEGYHSIRQTQRNYFPDNIVGCGTESGLGFPPMDRLAHAYDIPYSRIASHAEMEAAIKRTIEAPGPQICEVILDLEQAFAPKLASRKLPDGRMISPPLEDMAPFLDRAEFNSNMIIPPLEG